jgi:TolB protein
MNLDGTDQRQLTHTGKSARNSHPAWSPDGSQIVFQAEPVAGRENIQVISAYGTDVQQLTARRNSMRPAWSPDGSQIAFSSVREGQWEIFVIDADSSDQRRLTSERAGDCWPHLQP